MAQAVLGMTRIQETFSSMKNQPHFLQRNSREWTEKSSNRRKKTSNCEFPQKMIHWGLPMVKVACFETFVVIASFIAWGGCLKSPFKGWFTIFLFFFLISDGCDASAFEFKAHVSVRLMDKDWIQPWRSPHVLPNLCHNLGSGISSKSFSLI